MSGGAMSPTAMSPTAKPRATGGASATRLLLIRHGQSQWNAEGRWQGRADVPLDRAGMLQAAAAAEVLGVFDAIWSSHLQRAVLTAQIIAELTGIGPVQVDERLCENDVGPWEGLAREQVEAGWPGFLAHRRRPEGFESYDDAAARMSAALVQIASAHPGGEVLVISHGGVIGALRRSLGGPDERYPNLGGGWLIAEHTPAHSAQFQSDTTPSLRLGERVAVLDAADPLPVSDTL